MRTNLILLAALALTGGCLSPERVTRSTLEIRHGTNYIKSSTPKEYKVKKLSWTEHGLEVEGLHSAVNTDAVEAQVQAAQIQSQNFSQAVQLLQVFGGLASQQFGGGGLNRAPQVVTNYIQLPPQVVTNFVYVPVSAINTITNK